MELNNTQKVVILVTGVNAAGGEASLEGGTLTYVSTNPEVGSIIGEETPGGPVKLVGVKAGECAVVVTFTRGDLVLTKTSENVTITDVTSVVDIEVKFGEVEPQ